jgi:hypothetical protein
MEGGCRDFIDVARAYSHAKARREVYVELSKEEDSEECERGLLKKAMYGASDAAQNWEAGCTETMSENGFVQEKSSACVFYREKKKVRIVVHGDDCTVLGKSKS